MTATSSTDRRALQSVATQFFVNGAVVSSFIPRLPEIRDRLDISLSTLGLILTAEAALGIIGSGLAPLAIQRVGSRRVLIVGSATLVGSMVGVGFSRSIAALIASLAVLALVDVAVDIAMNMQGSWLSGRRSVPVMNRLHGLWSLGTVSGSIVASQAASAGVSLEVHLVVVAAVLLAAVVFVSRGLLADDQVPHPASAGAVPPPRRRLLWMMGLAGAFAIAVEIVSSDWAAFRLRDDLATSVGFAGLGFVAYTVGMTLGRFGGDAVLVRLGEQRQARIALVASAIGLAGASFAPDRWVVLVAYLLAGLGNSTMFPMLYDRAAKLPAASAAGLGALTAGSRVMFLIAPVVIGSLAASSWSVGAAVAVITLPSILGFAVLTLRR